MSWSQSVGLVSESMPFAILYLEVEALVGLLADAPLSRAQRPEILARSRNHISEKLENHPADWRRR